MTTGTALLGGNARELFHAAIVWDSVLFCLNVL